MSALQIIFHLTFPPAPPWRLPSSLCYWGYWRRQEPHSSEKHLTQKKHALTSLSKLWKNVFAHTALLRGTKESDFKGSLNWNVDISKVSSDSRFNKLLLHSSLLTVWPETIPGNSSKPSTITLWHLASNWLRLRKLRASPRAPSRGEQSASQALYQRGFGAVVGRGASSSSPVFLQVSWEQNAFPASAERLKLLNADSTSPLPHTRQTLQLPLLTGRGKVKPLLGVKGQMQNKQLQARLEGKS